ncbi:MAG: aspartate carbamoyltransferase, partial [Clostridia bacterium]
MYLNKRNLLGLRDLTAADMREILHSAETMKYMLSQPLKRAPHLLGKSIVEIFTGESIRTKLSFELAAKYMSGTLSTVNVPENSKRERILDIATAVDRMGADAIIIRNPRSGVANLISRHVNATVINAGDGMNE